MPFMLNLCCIWSFEYLLESELHVSHSNPLSCPKVGSCDILSSAVSDCLLITKWPNSVELMFNQLIRDCSDWLLSLSGSDHEKRNEKTYSKEANDSRLWVGVKQAGSQPATLYFHLIYRAARQHGCRESKHWKPNRLQQQSAFSEHQCLSVWKS